MIQVLATLLLSAPLPAQDLYGTTVTHSGGTISLLRIDPATGAAGPVLRDFDIGTATNFASLTYHTPSGLFVALSSDARIVTLDTSTCDATILPITGLPPGTASSEGIEYWDAQDRLMVTVGATFNSTELAEIDLTGAVVSGPVVHGLADLDALAESPTGQLFGIDYNSPAQVAVIEIIDPFGTLLLVPTATNPPSDSTILDPAIDPTTGTIHSSKSGTQLVEVLPASFSVIGTIGSAQPVFGLAYGVVAPVPSSEVPRLGSPPNPNVFLPGQTSGPVIGEIWDPVVDHTSFFPGAVLDIVGVTVLGTNLPIPPFGTLLCDISTPPFLFTSTPGVPFSIAFPFNCNLTGVALCSQAGSADLTSVQLTNGLDLIVGAP